MQQEAHALQAMPFDTEFQKRDKALFAFFMMIYARMSAMASLKLWHVNLELSRVFQGAREVNTKGAKTIHCQFYPFDKAYYECFAASVDYWCEVKLFGPEDTLFPQGCLG